MKNTLKKKALAALSGGLASAGRVVPVKLPAARVKRLGRVAACLALAAFMFAAGAAWRHYAVPDAPDTPAAASQATALKNATPGAAPQTTAATEALALLKNNLQAALPNPASEGGLAANIAAPAPDSEQAAQKGPATLDDFPQRMISRQLTKNLDFTFHRLGDGRGPVLLVVGGIQGDEPGGFSAASLLVTHYNITKGTVWVVPNLNFPSIILRERGPNGDMNRKFAALSRQDPEYDTVTKIKGIILAPEVEAVLNLHDGSGFYRPQWEGPLHNPARWGQSVIIDQDELRGHRLGGLKDLAGYAVDRANTVLLEPEHRYHLKNTNTRAGDKEMEKTLTYFAICNGKPAFGVEASKNVPLPVRAYYHTQVLESFMHQLGIKFARRFELSPQGVSAALEDGALLSFAGNRLVLPLIDARGSLNHIPLQRGEKLEFQTASPLLTLVENNGVLDVRYGNRLLTKLAPDYLDYDTSLPGLAVQVDGARQEVPFGREVLLSKNSRFLVEGIPGYRINVIGYVGKRDDESNEELRLKQFMPRFSLDNAGTAFRVEVYRADKSGSSSNGSGTDKDKFAGMIMVRFADKNGNTQARRSALPGTEGRETELGW